MFDHARDIDEPALAMAYVPMQALNNVFSPHDAIIAGTLFPCLFKPFEACRREVLRHE